MCKIYIDFDGVLVDTPKYIKKIIKSQGNCEETFINIKWNILLKKCNELCNNITYLKKIYKENDITILTHIYSQSEKEEKLKYIKEKIGDIEVLAVPYNIKKNEYVKAENNLLIDDYNHNITLWMSAGGLGLLFKNETKLEDILQKYIMEEYV